MNRPKALISGILLSTHTHKAKNINIYKYKSTAKKTQTTFSLMIILNIF